jgi:hypothetical protein
MALTLTRKASGPAIVALVGAVTVAALWFLSPHRVLLAAAALFAVAVLISLPRYALPAIALVAFALLPAKQLPFPGEPATLNPGFVVMGVWLVRQHLDVSRLQRRIPVGLVLLGGWLGLSVLHSSHRSTSLWSAVSLIVLGLATAGAIARSDEQTRALLVKSWVRLGGWLGLFALVETFVLKANPLYDWAYQSSSAPLLQVWSTHRATTTLGHPLVNALFFVLAMLLAYSEWQRVGGRVQLVCAALAVGGLLATVSRGGVVALVGGFVMLSLVTASAAGSRRSRRLGLPVMAVVIAVLTLFGASLLGGRSNTHEGTTSSQYRITTLQDGVKLVKLSPVVGVGVGNTDSARKAIAIGRFRNLGLENSWVELFVGLGIPGGLIALYVFLAAFGMGFKSGNAIGCALVVAYALMAASFNLIEQNRPAHLVLGLVLGLAMAPPLSHPDHALAPEGHAAHAIA